MAMEKQTLTAHVPLAIAERLAATAEHLDMSTDQIIAEALNAWLDREQDRRLVALRTIAATNPIVVVEHDRVIDWADSL
jgi:predicted transcriptional regulator